MEPEVECHPLVRRGVGERAAQGLSVGDDYPPGSHTIGPTLGRPSEPLLASIIALMSTMPCLCDPGNTQTPLTRASVQLSHEIEPVRPLIPVGLVPLFGPS